MWQLFYPTHRDPTVARASLLQSLGGISRGITLLLGGSALLLFVLLAPPRPGPHGWQMFAITAAWLAISVLAYTLAGRRLLLANLLLLGGIALLLPLAVAVSSQPLLVALYAGLPALAMILVGWPAALAALLYVAAVPTAATATAAATAAATATGTAAAATAPTALAAPLGPLTELLAGTPPLPPTTALALLAFGLAGALLCWIVTGSLLSLAETALHGLARAQAAVDEARAGRLELKQVEEDLLQATGEQARLLDRLKAMNQVAEEARQSKQEFIAKVSHELRTPLNMIIAYSELITESPGLYGGRIPGALLADMSVILRNSQHLSKLVDDVLDLSQIDAGRMALSKTWVDLGAIAHEAAEAVRPLFHTKGLYLDLQIGAPPTSPGPTPTGPTPPPDPPQPLPPLYCDPTRIRQVLLNLLSNAGRFTPTGGVRLHAWAADDQLHVTVADTGEGIDPRDRAHLFEPFQQIDASIRRKHGGSGLGLNISKQFVEMHGGHIWLEDHPPTPAPATPAPATPAPESPASSPARGGTVFHVSLPLTPAPAPGDTLTPSGARRWVHPYNAYVPRTRPRIAPLPQVKPRYVVLEHGHILARLLSRYLHNAEVLRVGAWDEGIALLAESPARAFVVNAAALDRPSAETPGADTPGAEPPRSAELPFATPLITCWLPWGLAPTRPPTGPATNPANPAGPTPGAVHYLVKPVRRDDLAAAMDALGADIRTVLVCDDEPDILRLFLRMLGSLPRPYRILTATDGAEALATLRTLRPDAVILDLLMPEMTGFEFLEAKAADPTLAPIPVIVASSLDPNSEPILSRQLLVARGRGLSSRDLLQCIEALSAILAPDPGTDPSTDTSTDTAPSADAAPGADAGLGADLDATPGADTG